MQQSTQYLRLPFATRLLYEPFSESILDLFLCETTVIFDRFETLSDFIYYVQVILQILDRGIAGQTIY